jgi:hypothetical protein
MNGMKKILLVSTAVLLTLNIQGQVLPYNASLLNDLKAAYHQGDKAAIEAVGKLETQARKAIQVKAPVVKSKKLPPSNDPRDYMSLSRYWWPDSTKVDGLPYVRHDGLVNPEIDDYTSAKSAGKMSRGVDVMAMMYYITADTLYAYHCARYLRAWFLDSKTGMNPNMIFAQIIPGRTYLRGTGILDARHICRALNMSTLIESYPGWTADDRAKLQAWAGSMLYWIENSTQGRKEREAANNHGLWYDVTHMELLAYLNCQDDIRLVVFNDLLRKLDSEIAADGSLPKELERTLSLHYSTFVLEALCQAAELAKSAGVNLWTSTTASGRKLTDIIVYLLPYWQHPERWPHQQIKPFDPQRAAMVLYEVAQATGSKKYLQEARKIGISSDNKKIQNILYYQLIK